MELSEHINLLQKRCAEFRIEILEVMVIKIQLGVDGTLITDTNGSLLTRELPGTSSIMHMTTEDGEKWMQPIDPTLIWRMPVDRPCKVYFHCAFLHEMGEPEGDMILIIGERATDQDPGW